MTPPEHELLRRPWERRCPYDGTPCGDCQSGCALDKAREFCLDEAFARALLMLEAE